MSDDLNPLESAFNDLRDEAVQLDTAAARQTMQRRRIPVRAMVAAAAVVVLAAVAVAQLTDNPASELDVTPADELNDSQSLDGTSWILESAETPGGLIGFIGGLNDQYTLSFSADTIGGRVDCNTFGADYVRSGSAIEIEPLVVTEALCGDNATLGENYLDALDAVTDIDVTEAHLTLTGPGVEVNFVRSGDVPLAQIVERTWQLVAVTEGDTTSEPQGDAAVLQLTSDGTISASTGCRTLDGDFVITGNEIRTTSFSAAGDCSAELQAQDDVIVATLSDGFTAEVVDRTLVIRDGDQGLAYIPADPETVAPPPSTVEFPTPSRWALVSGEGPDGGDVIHPDSNQTIEIGPDGDLTVMLGCNSGSGDLTLDGQSFRISRIRQEQVACGPEEGNFSAALSDVTEWALEGPMGLILTGPATELIFERAATDIEDPTAGFVEFLYAHFATQDINYAGACPDADEIDETTVCSGDPRQTDDPDVYAALVGLALDYTGDQGAPFATDFGVADLLARRLRNGEWELVDLITVGIPAEENVVAGAWQSSLELVPATWFEDTVFEFNDHALFYDIAGVERPQTRDEFLDLTIASLAGGDFFQGNVVGIGGPDGLDIETWRSSFGFSVVDISRSITPLSGRTSGAFYQVADRSHGIDDPGANDEGYIERRELIPTPIGTMWDWGDEVRGGPLTSTRRAGRGGQIFVRGDDVVRTTSRADVDESITAATTETALADNADLAGLVGRMQQLGSFRFYVWNGDYGEINMEIADPQLVAYEMIASGIRFVDGRYEYVWVLVNSDEATAAENATRFVDVIAQGSSALTGDVWSDVFLDPVSSTDGRLSIVTANLPADGSQDDHLRALLRRDSFYIPE